jgi:hypothetical protein
MKKTEVKKSRATVPLTCQKWLLFDKAVEIYDFKTFRKG